MTISAVVPCYNAAQYLGQAIESALGQTRALDEIIVVDDCSSDGSSSVARRYPLRVLQTPANSGPATARTLGIQAARGDLIAWLDADDFWDRNHIEVLCSLLDRFPQAAVAYSGIRFFGARSGSWSGFPCNDKPMNIFWGAFRGTPVPAMTALTRKDALVEVGGCDESVRIAPDFDLWLRLSRQHLFVSTNRVTSNYRWHGGQISQNPYPQWKSVYESRRRLLEQVKAEGDLGLARRLEGEMLEIWQRDLRSAWYRRDTKRLRFYLGLAHLVPRSEEVRGRFRWRTHLPMTLLRVWDYIGTLRECRLKREQ